MCGDARLIVKSSVRVGRMTLVRVRPVAAITGLPPIQTQRRSAVNGTSEEAANACVSQVFVTRGGLTQCENQRCDGISNPASSM